MKLIRNEKTEKHHEIEIEKSFLFVKWRVKYRKVKGDVYRFKCPNNYYPTVLSEHINVGSLFYAEVD